MMSAVEYLWGWMQLACLVGLALFSSSRLCDRFFPRPSRSERMLVLGLLAWANLLFPALALGALGALRVGWLILALACQAGISLLASRGKASRQPPLSPPRLGPRPTDAVDAALVALYAFAAVLLAERGLAHVPLGWDALEYHLPMMAEWIQTGSLDPIFHPHALFQGYFPATGDLTFFYLAAPLRNDLLVGLGNLPLLALQGVAIYRIARRAGAPPAYARFAPALYLLTPCVARMAPAAYVEPALGAALLGAVALLLDLRAERRTADLWLFLVTLGVLVGTKYTGLVLSVPLGLGGLAYARRTRWVPALLGAVPFVALGAFWYWRNWGLTGNPFYPMPVSLFGIEIFDGLPIHLGTARLGHSVSIFSALPDLVSSGDLGRALLGVAAPDRFELGIGPKLLPLAVFSVTTLPALRAKPALRVPWLLLAAFAGLYLLTPIWILHFLYLNVRFAAPALAMLAVLASVGLARTGVDPRWALLALALAVAPDVMSLTHEVSPAFAVLGATLAGVVALAHLWPRLASLARRRWLHLALALALVAGGYALHRSRESGRARDYATGWDLYRTTAGLYAPGWAALDRAVGPNQPARVAHTGASSFLFPLYGPRLRRRVFYVDINAHAGGAAHRYPKGRFRADPNEGAWRANLARSGAEYLVIYHPDPGVPGDWPVEARWARGWPEGLVPLHRDSWIRLYRVRGATRPGNPRPGVTDG